MKNTNQQLKDIMTKLDTWVNKWGSGNYISETFVSTVTNNLNIPENFGIQQVRKEIESFVKVLLSYPREKRYNVLEIGLGYFGSTHFLWRHLFEKVITIEYQRDRIFVFGENTQKHYGKWILDDLHSAFIFGKSNDIEVIKKTYDNLSKSKVNMLFIDGDHKYEGVMSDYLLYEPLVCDGGIVAFHDCVSKVDFNGVPKFLDDLSDGKFKGPKKLNKIIFSLDAGIAYYIK